MDTPKRKRPLWHYALPLVLALCVCSGIAAVIPRPGAPRETPASAQPTDTTIAARAASTKAPTVDATDAAYQASVLGWSDRWATSLRQFGELNSNPKIGDLDWTVTVVASLLAIEDVDKEVRAYKAPPRYTTVHARLVNAAQHYDRFSKGYRDGMDAKSLPALDTARKEMELGTGQIQEATKAIQKLTP